MTHRPSAPVLSLPGLSALAAVVLLAGCATGTGPQAESLAPTALDAWQDQVRVLPAPVDIRLAPHDTGLSAPQAAALEEFVGQWLKAEGREIQVRAPETGPEARGANRVAWDARDRLLSLGVPPSAIRMQAYDGSDQPRAPVVISFSRYVVETPTCGNWRNLSHSSDNRVYDNFGCAIAANMAAQIASPEDLLNPRDMTAADAQQRGVMFEKYRQGKATGSERDEKATGAVSQVVN
ncbi:MAG: CpaD family pilus assembly protein [Caulobacter sp.]|nr:CpaD family pilus assembly protein [Caulobacter sp.]